MASNDQWPPVASTGKGAIKANGNKRNVKDLQQKVLKKVNEMFGSALEPEVILTVVQNCNWELQPSIEGLITLSETVDNAPVWNNAEDNKTMIPLASLTVHHPLGLKGGSSEDSKSELIAQETPPVDPPRSEPPTPPKSDKPKRSVTKNRMGAFCGNIAKLKSPPVNNATSSTEQIPQKSQEKRDTAVKAKSDVSFDDILNYGASGLQSIIDNYSKPPNYGHFPDLPIGTQTAGIYPPAGYRENIGSPGYSKGSIFLKQQPKRAQQFLDTKAAAEDLEFNTDRKAVDSKIKTCARKLETESRSKSLKVQYRMSGMESSSDDDADVVIEVESSDYERNLEPSIFTNVDQFLSPPTQTAPRRTQPEFHIISTPSPPRTPQRNAHDITLERIKSTVEKGYKIMVLMRGLPGSGKSTLARSIIASTIGGDPTPYIFSTDDFFYYPPGRGTYEFDPSKLPNAHSFNQKRVRHAFSEGRSPVIVDNTNIQAAEMKTYAQSAVEAGYIVEIIEPNTPWAKNIDELAKKNTHNVPKSRIRNRAQGYETIANAKSLLDRYSLKYSEHNKPPQMRYVPPYVPPNLEDTEEYWNDKDKNSYILSSHDIESMQNIDETHSTFGGISERASIATDSSETSSNPGKAANFNDESFDYYLEELQDSDDESFEMLEGSGSDNLSDINGTSAESTKTDSSHQSLAKLLTDDSTEESVGETKDTSSKTSLQIFGAIGSERKGSFSVGAGNLVENEKTEKKDPSPHSVQQTLGAIGCERKGSLSVASSVGNPDNDKTEATNLSPNNSQRDLGAVGSERKESTIGGTSVGNIESDADESKDYNVRSPMFESKSAAEIKESNVEPMFESKLPVEIKDSNDRPAMLKPQLTFPISPTSARRILRDLNTEDSRRCAPEEEAKRRHIDEMMGFCQTMLNRGCPNQNTAEDEQYRRLLELIAAGESETKEDSVEIIELENEIKKGNESNVESIFDHNDSAEYLEPQEFPAEQLNDDSLSIEEIRENLVEEACEIEIKAKNDETLFGEETIDTQDAEGEATSSEIQTPEFSDARSKESSVEIQSTDLVDGNIDDEDTKGKTDEVVEGKTEEVAETSPKVGTFGTLLNLLKTSVLGSAEATSSSDAKYENLDESGSSTYETIPNESLTTENKSGPTEDEFNNTVNSSSVLKKSSDDDSLVEIAPNVASVNQEKPADQEYKAYADLSANSFREEIIKSQEKDSSKDDTKLVNDNINSISWKESPFPVDAAKISLLPWINIEKKPVLKVDAFTNTTYYDFNVAYVGGTSEPGYREITPVSRSINQGHSVAKPERPPLKLMLDKSSMTSEVNILSTEPNSTDEKEKDSTDRIHELVELFPNIPIDHLTTFYNDQCKGDFAWTVEMLLEGVPTDFTIKELRDKHSKIDTDDSNSIGADSDKKGNIDVGRFKQRSHSSSPRHRRQRTKDFRSVCLENLEDSIFSSAGLATADEKGIPSVEEDKQITMDSLYEQAASILPVKIESPEASSSSTASGLTETEDESEDAIELDFGREFVNKLEETMGNTHFIFPEEFKPIIRIKKSMAEELHALWIQSMYEQLNERHAKLDEMIAKDEAIARALAREETVKPVSQPVVPNLEEIMDMEMARARYQNELKEKIAKETPNDIASRLSRSLLHELFPDLNPEILSEILKAHGGNFKETCETIETSTGRTIHKTDTLKKQQILLDFVKEESKIRGIQENCEDNYTPLFFVRPDVNAISRDDKWSYKAALARGQNARDEAQKQLSLRMENLNKAAEAYRKGQPGVAAYYSEMAKLHSDHSAAAHEEAADAFVSAQVLHSDGTLDLHYLFVPEALRALDLFLELQYEKLAKSGKKKVTLFIITGRGARSNHGQSKIKPAVSKSLNSRNIRFTEANAGCLEVTLSKKNGILK